MKTYIFDVSSTVIWRAESESEARLQIISQSSGILEEDDLMLISEENEDEE